MHIKDTLPKAEAKFLSTLTHGASVRMAHGTESVFPYDESECQRLLDIYWDLSRKYYFSVPYNNFKG